MALEIRYRLERALKTIPELQEKIARLEAEKENFLLGRGREDPSERLEEAKKELNLLFEIKAVAERKLAEYKKNEGEANKIREEYEKIFKGKVLPVVEQLKASAEEMKDAIKVLEAQYAPLKALKQRHEQIYGERLFGPALPVIDPTLKAQLATLELPDYAKIKIQSESEVMRERGER